MFDPDLLLEETGIFAHQLGIVEVDAEVDLDDRPRRYVHYLHLVVRHVGSRGQGAFVHPQQMPAGQELRDMELPVLVGGHDRAVLHHDTHVRHRPLHDLPAVLVDVLRIVLAAVVVVVVEDLAEDRAQIEERVHGHLDRCVGHVGDDQPFGIFHVSGVLVCPLDHPGADDQLVAQGLFLARSERPRFELQRTAALRLGGRDPLQEDPSADVLEPRRDQVIQPGVADGVAGRKAFDHHRIGHHFADLGFRLVGGLFDLEERVRGIHREVHVADRRRDRKGLAFRPRQDGAGRRQLRIGELGGEFEPLRRDDDVVIAIVRQERIQPVGPGHAWIDVTRVQILPRDGHGAVRTIDSDGRVLQDFAGCRIEYHPVQSHHRIGHERAGNAVDHHREIDNPFGKGRGEAERELAVGSHGVLPGVGVRRHSQKQIPLRVVGNDHEPGSRRSLSLYRRTAADYPFIIRRRSYDRHLFDGRGGHDRHPVGAAGERLVNHRQRNVERHRANVQGGLGDRVGIEVGAILPQHHAEIAVGVAPGRGHHRAGVVDDRQDAVRHAMPDHDRHGADGGPVRRIQYFQSSEYPAYIGRIASPVLPVDGIDRENVCGERPGGGRILDVHIDHVLEVGHRDGPRGAVNGRTQDQLVAGRTDHVQVVKDGLVGPGLEINILAGRGKDAQVVEGRAAVDGSIRSGIKGDPPAVGAEERQPAGVRPPFSDKEVQPGAGRGQAAPAQGHAAVHIGTDRPQVKQAAAY